MFSYHQPGLSIEADYHCGLPPSNLLPDANSVILAHANSNWKSVLILISDEVAKCLYTVDHKYPYDLNFS
jgi:hypothetical protein